MKAVIMCGGSGTRLWPISRKSSPKQFVKIFEGKSLFQLTLDRNLNLVDEFIIVVNEKQLALCKEQIPNILSDKVTFIIEPVGRNTAPAITLAAALAKDSELLILASDHLIKDQIEYENCIKKAQKFSSENKLVTFGIQPHYPETGYGYIESNGNTVLSFKEKPKLELAKQYLKAGNYLWNSGMFLFNSKIYLNELNEFNSKIHDFSKDALDKANQENNIYYIQDEDMLKIPANSIDYAVMEKSQNVMVVPSNFNWSDLGSFDSLYEELAKDENGNTQAELIKSINSKNNLILSSKRVISLFDVEDLIIVDTNDALLIGKKGNSQKVKEILKIVEKTNPELLD